MICPHCNKSFNFTKLTTKDIKQIRELHAAGLSVRAIGETIKVSPSKVHRVLKAIKR